MISHDISLPLFVPVPTPGLNSIDYIPKLIIFLASWKTRIYVPLNISSISFARDDIYGKPDCSIWVAIYPKGGYDMGQVMQRVENVVKIAFRRSGDVVRCNNPVTMGMPNLSGFNTLPGQISQPLCSPEWPGRIIAPLRMPLSEVKTDQTLIQISEQFRYPSNSNMLLAQPQFETRYELFGNPVEQFVPITALCQRSCAISIMSISYNGKMGISITADKALFGRKVDLERFINQIINEISEFPMVGPVTTLRDTPAFWYDLLQG
ncbi:hypothetical protein Fcan01_16034 [Folsomia candida]|uniref:O-acyltransferase WSD1 C-terminal domain-containing protein n=1 Tax=Folsomia candida TaxID=158441 RepID=A0A226DZ91_FOLCA|nr:hypothetical protein Fcan01_16034 [Folsomia candida]